MIILLSTLASAFNLTANCSQFSNHYFDTSLFQCVSCSSDKTPTSDFSSCECAPGFAKSQQTRDDPSFTCVSCGSQSPSSDDYLCQSCPGGLTQTFQCQCDQQDYQVAQQFSQGGDYLDSKICLQCDPIAYPGPDNTQCQMCPDTTMIRDQNYQCSCPQGSTIGIDLCMPDDQIQRYTTGTFPQNQAITVIYTSLDTDSRAQNSVNSATFSYFYLQSAWECQELQYVEGCQILANLCVLVLYNQERVVCDLFQQIGESRNSANNDEQDTGWNQDMPWLYYESPVSSILENEDILLQVTFDPDEDNKVNSLTFQLAKYSLDGEYLGSQELTDQLILCPHSPDDTSAYREFGTNLEIKCQLDITDYIYQDETIFYELFLVDQDQTLHDVPVRVKNFIDNISEQPNESSNEDEWRLTRRFFLYDNVSGISSDQDPDAYINGVTTQFLTYPIEIQLKVELRTDEDARIYVPLLTIQYRTRPVVDILQSLDTDEISFKSRYTMDTEDFWADADTMFIISNVIVFLVWVCRMYVWSKNNPARYSQQTYLIWIFGKSLSFLIGIWAFIIFFYLFGITGYWFIFYKMQYDVYILIPPSTTVDSDYQPFVILFGLVVSCQLLWVFDLIRSQAKTDFHLIDWEKPKRIPGFADQLEAAIFRGEDVRSVQRELSVSAWRTIFVANELSELQSIRLVNMEFTLLLFLFFMEGLGFSELATAQPNLNIGTNSNSPNNIVLRFFLTSFLFLVIGYSQVIIRKLFSLWIPTPLHNFVDLCAIANISVFILDQSLHGYYIHGVSPVGKADIPFDELLRTIQLEKRGSTRPRGILPQDSSELQTYQIYIPWRMRQTIDNLGKDPIDAEVTQHKKRLRDQQASQIVFDATAVPKDMNFDTLNVVRQELNNRMKNYIAVLIKDSQTRLLNKTALQRFLSMPPTDLSILEGSPFFYRDKGMSFESIFFMGREFSVLLMDLLVFALFDMNTQNTLLSVFCTYVWSKFIMYLRQKTGRWNLARKTLVEENFLV